jgi:hypothetical protein
MSAAELSKALRDTAKKVDDARYELACACDGGSALSESDLTKMARDMDAAGELIRVLARLVEGKSIPQAFGAPGDFGYHTPIGAALNRYYRAPNAAQVG